MGKRIAFIIVTACVLLITGCGASNSAEAPAGADSQIVENAGQTDTDTFPENNGETNFNPELGMPYAQVEGGIAVLYKNEWYLGTPFSNENTITFTGIIIDHTVESLRTNTTGRGYTIIKEK